MYINIKIFSSFLISFLILFFAFFDISIKKKEKCCITSNEKINKITLVKKINKLKKEEIFDKKLKNNLNELKKTIINKDSSLIDFYISKIDKNELKKYIFLSLNKNSREKIDKSLYIIYLEINSKLNLTKIFKLKSNEVIKNIIINATIHYILTKNKSNLFDDNYSSLDNILSRSILLSVIAHIETGYFNYNKTIFSPTKAFGRYQINGNTLGINFKSILNRLDINPLFFQKYPLNSLNRNLLISLSENEKYKNLLNKYFNTKNKKIKNKIRKKLYKIEKNLFNNITKYIFINIKNISNKDISKKDISKYKSLLKRTIYGIEQNEPDFLKEEKNAFFKRLLYIKISSILIFSSIKNQGVLSLIVLESKYKNIKRYKKIKINIQKNEKNFLNILRNIAIYYNGSDTKKIYAKKVRNHAAKIFKNLN
jgi:hypothetical protein